MVQYWVEFLVAQNVLEEDPNLTTKKELTTVQVIETILISTTATVHSRNHKSPGTHGNLDCIFLIFAKNHRLSCILEYIFMNTMVLYIY